MVEQLFRNEPPAEFRIDFKHKAPAQIDKQVQTVANFINFSDKTLKLEDTSLCKDILIGAKPYRRYIISL